MKMFTISNFSHSETLVKGYSIGVFCCCFSEIIFFFFCFFAAICDLVHDVDLISPL